MKLKQARSVYPSTAIAVFLFASALANTSWGDDKHKSAPPLK